MKVVSTFHPSTSIISSVKCRLTTKDLEHLVVVKLNRLDVYSVRTHGLQHECGLDIWGKICSVKALPLSDYEVRSNIVAMITHPEPELIILKYSEDEDRTGHITVAKTISLFERAPRPAEFFTDFLIHPSGKLGVVSCYANKLKVITFKGGEYVEEFDATIPETNILSLSYLPIPDGDFALAVLHIDAQERLQLCARDIDVDGLEISHQLSTFLAPTVIAEHYVAYPTDTPLHIIPVPPEDVDEVSGDAFLGGILVAGGDKFVLYEIASKDDQERQRGKQKRLESKKKGKDAAEAAKAKAKEQERGNRKRKPKATLEWPWSALSSWTTIEGAPFRFLLGDLFGRLSLLSVENVNEMGMILVPLGQTSSATTLTYLTNQTVYLGSHLGDSQLFKILDPSSSVSSDDSPALVVPIGIKTVSAGSLAGVSSKKGKEKAHDTDMEVDEEESKSYFAGRIVDTAKSLITVLETYKNIAPIMDAILVDTDNSKQHQIVTCSGGANTGSVNVIRSGAEYTELASIPGITNVLGVWSAKSDFTESYDTHIFISLINESLLFEISNVGGKTSLKHVEGAPLGGLVTSERTLAFASFCRRSNSSYGPSNLVVQVTSTGAYLLEWDSSISTYRECALWVARTSLPQLGNTPLEVVAASINNSQVALALTGGRIVLLCIENNADRFRQIMTHSTQSEISAISILPPDPTKKFSTVLSVAYWRTKSVQIFAFSKGVLVSDEHTRSPALPAVVRSLLLYKFISKQSPEGTQKAPDDTSETQEDYIYLLAGLGDGSVATLRWKDAELTEEEKSRGEKKKKVLTDLKIVSLGHAPVNFTPCVVENTKCVFAAGNKSTIFFNDNGRLANSSITLKEISALSRLNTRNFPDSLILAAPHGLFIGSVGNLKKMNIRSTFFGSDNPRKIAYSQPLKAFGVACVQLSPGKVSDSTMGGSSFHVLDDTTLATLAKYSCEENEEITSLVSFTSDEKPFFCLGTMIFQEDEKEPSSGKLLVLTAYSGAVARTSTLEISTVASAEVKGCVYALQNVNGKIVAAVNSSIILYDFVSSDPLGTESFKLKKVAEWNHNYLVTSLSSFNDHIAAGDQISSVSLLKIDKDKLVSVARDFGPLYPISVEAIDSKNIIASNDTLNIVLFTLLKNMRGEALENVGCYHLGDLITKFVRGSISIPNTTEGMNPQYNPELVFFTSSGKIGIITDVQDVQLSLHLTELQRNLAAAIPGVGGKSHTRYRAPKSTRGTSDADGSARGFVDGDFLEQFLSIQSSPEMLSKVMKGGSAPEALRLSPEEILKVLQDLQSLH